LKTDVPGFWGFLDSNRPLHLKFEQLELSGKLKPGRWNENPSPKNDPERNAGIRRVGILLPTNELKPNERISDGIY
jgi:hypothetical protein